MLCTTELQTTRVKYPHGSPWNSMEVHGVPWNSVEFHVPNPDRIPWSPMENFPWNSMEFRGIPCPKPRQNSMEFHGKFSMEFHGIPWGYFTREYKQKTSLQCCKTQIKILTYPGLA